MDDKEYRVFEAVATPAMLRAMEAVRAELVGLGHVTDQPALVDHDVERGIGLASKHPDRELPFSVELVLADGDERGFGRKGGMPECGLLLSVIGPEGESLGEWCPFNFTSQVGTSDPDELVRRLDLLEPSILARAIHSRLSSWAEGHTEGVEAPRG